MAADRNRHAPGGGEDEAARVQSILGLLGLARRAGALVLGSGAVLRALRDERPGVVFLARDAGADLGRKVGWALGDSRLDRTSLSGEDLARCFGRQRLAVVSVHDPAFVKGLVKHMA